MKRLAPPFLMVFAGLLAACGVGPTAQELQPTPGVSTNAPASAPAESPAWNGPYENFLLEEVPQPTVELRTPKLEVGSGAGLQAHQTLVKPGVNVVVDLTSMLAYGRKAKVFVGQMGCGWLGLAQGATSGQCYAPSIVEFDHVLPQPEAFTVIVIEDTDGDGKCSQTDSAWEFNTGYGVLPSGTVKVKDTNLKPLSYVPCYVDRP